MSADTAAPKLDAPQPKKKLAPSGGLMMNLGTRDPFAEADAFSQPRSGAGTPSNEELPGGSGGKIHIRIQQRNGRKMITSVQGLDKAYDAKKILKAFKKEFACNGTVVSSEEAAAESALDADPDAAAGGKSSSAHVKTAAPTNKGKDFGQVIQLQGDQRVHVRDFLINTGIVNAKEAKEKIQVHGH